MNDRPASFAILGGSFDPIHSGHIDIACQVQEMLGIGQVLLLPDGDPPHKRAHAAKRDRMEMTRLAAMERPGLVASSLEIDREGTTYTVDTLTEFKARDPGREIFYIIGADTLMVLDSWRNFPRVAHLCRFCAIGRPGGDDRALENKAADLKREYGADITILPACGPAISSTDIRARAAEGESLAGLVPPAVESYIRNNGLYLTNMPEEDIPAELAKRLKPSRYSHTLAVRDTAVRLAARYGVSPHRAAVAALLHDAAKPLPEEEARSLARQVPDADEEELATPPVLHAPAGAVVAYRDFGVRDREILRAIRCHTLGASRMTNLEKLIFVSDFIEPTRADFPGLAEARRLAETDLAACARLCASLTARYLVSTGAKPHPRTLKWIKEEDNGK